MPRFGIEPGITPNRTTSIVLDPEEKSVLEPPFSRIRTYGQICAGSGSSKSNVKLEDGVGWKLTAVDDDPSRARQTVEGQLSIITAASGNLILAPKFVERDTWKKVPSVTYESDVADTGDPFWQKQLGAGDDAEQRLTVDQTNFPGVFVAGSSENVDVFGRPFIVGMDRVAKTKNPDDIHAFKEWRVSFAFNDSRVSEMGPITAFYFNGPASEQKNFIGFGQYSVVKFASGQAWLCERGIKYDPESGGVPVSVAWKLCDVFKYHPTGVSSSSKVSLDVTPIFADVSQAVVGSKHGAIRFRTQGSGYQRSDAGVGSKPTFQSFGAGTGIKKAYDGLAGFTYIVPRTPHGFVWDTDWESEDQPELKDHTPGVVKPTLVRIDMRRDLRASGQLRKFTYETSGYLVDDVFSLQFVPAIDATMVVNFWGEQPGTSILRPRLYKVFGDDTQDVEILATEDNNWSSKFPIPAGHMLYRVRFQFTGPSSVSPTLAGYQSLRDGSPFTVTPGEFAVDNPASFIAGQIKLPQSVGSDISISGQEADPSVASANFTVDDITGALPRLKTRGELGVRIEVAHPDLDRPVVLFRGDVVDPNAVILGQGGAAHGHPSRYGAKLRRYTLSAAGAWQRLSEAYSPVQLNWNGLDPTTFELGVAQPFKVTDAVRSMLGWAGFPPEMIDVPDLPLRFLNFNPSKDTQLDPLASLADLILLFVRQWLGMHLIWDDNARQNADPLVPHYGMWRVRYAKRAPYSYFCHFVTTAASAGKFQHMPASYGVAGDGRPIVPIRGRTLQPWKRRLRFNKLTVTTTGLVSGSESGHGKITKTYYNYQSFNFGGLDPGDPANAPYLPDPLHPDYRTRVKAALIVDPTIGGSQTDESAERAVDWVGRRMMSIAGNTKTGFRFQAALPFATEVGDEYSRDPRPPLYYDAVTIDGVDFLIRTCNPRYRKDRFMWADYEVEAPREDWL